MAPMMVAPSAVEARHRPSSSTSARTAGSRIDAPARATPRPARPRTAASPAGPGRRPGRRRRASAGEHGAQRDERQVGDDDVGRAADVAGRRGAGRWCARGPSTRGSARSRSWSWPCRRRRRPPARAPRWSRQSVKPPVDAPASRHAPPGHVDAEASSAASSFSPPRPTKRGGGPSERRSARRRATRRAGLSRRRAADGDPAGGDRRPGPRSRLAPGPAGPARRRAGAGRACVSRRPSWPAAFLRRAPSSPARFLAGAFLAAAFLAGGLLGWRPSWPAAFLAAAFLAAGGRGRWPHGAGAGAGQQLLHLRAEGVDLLLEPIDGVLGDRLEHGELVADLGLDHRDAAPRCSPGCARPGRGRRRAACFRRTSPAFTRSFTISSACSRVSCRELGAGVEVAAGAGCWACTGTATTAPRGLQKRPRASSATRSRSGRRARRGRRRPRRASGRPAGRRRR